MGLNWLEDIVAQLYKLKGYIVLQNEDLPMPIKDYRTVRGYSDIDVLAIKGNKVLHIECQSWWSPSPKEEEKVFRKLKDRFNQAETVIFEKYTFLNKNKFKVTNIFVVGGKPNRPRKGGLWDRLEQFGRKNGIQLVDVNTIIKEVIEILKQRYPRKERIGREEGVIRFLLHLIHNGFIKTSSGT